MLVGELIREEAQFVGLDDPAGRVRPLFDSLGVSMMPVVDADGRLKGLCRLEDVAAAAPELPIGVLPREAALSILAGAHLFEAASLLIRSDAEILAIIEEEGVLLGVLTRKSLLDHLIRILGILRAGAVLEIEMEPRDYTMGRLVHAIEQSSVKVLSLSSDVSDAGDGVSRITVKLDSTDASRVRHLLEHYGYRVVASYSEQTDEEEIRLRVEEFMRYLEA
jgi:acetoin utilization protein AcuB